jgi:hypothetical protein
MLRVGWRLPVALERQVIGQEEHYEWERDAHEQCSGEVDESISINRIRDG